MIDTLPWIEARTRSEPALSRRNMMRGGLGVITLMGMRAG